MANGATSTESFVYDELQQLTQSNRSTPGGAEAVNYTFLSKNVPAYRVQAHDLGGYKNIVNRKDVVQRLK